MKKQIHPLIFLVSLLIVSCSYNELPTVNNKLSGQWYLTEYFEDPFDGSGTWHKAMQTEIISFKNDNAFALDEGVSSFFPRYAYYNATSDSTLKLMTKYHLDTLEIQFKEKDRMLVCIPCV